MNGHGAELLPIDILNNRLSLHQSGLRVQHDCDLFQANHAHHGCGVRDYALPSSGFHQCVRLNNGV
jgi:hypothetical protein